MATSHQRFAPISSKTLPVYHRHQPVTPRTQMESAITPCRWYRLPVHPPQPGSHCVPASYRNSMYNKQWLRDHEDYLHASINGNATHRENKTSNFLNFVFIKPLSCKGVNFSGERKRENRSNSKSIAIQHLPLGEHSCYSSYIDRLVVMSSDPVSDPVADLSSVNKPQDNIEDWLKFSSDTSDKGIAKEDTMESTTEHSTDTHYVTVGTGPRKLKIPGYVLPPICEM